ncbi:Crp/Fnr family transcriptional regulator [Parapedobacter deserti]|uniref:Crp/Fnr family transcriptional regulator n=1 Tax=Parapedobacter deserti TaxID=1912957 RepID=A0ABV7JL47_9SPHI
MNTQVLDFFIEQLIANCDALNSFNSEIVVLLTPLLRKEHSTAARQLILKDHIPRKLYIKLSGFAMGSRESFRNLFPVAPYLWLKPALMTDWRALLKKKPARFDISVEQHTDVYSLSLADIKLLIERVPEVKTALRTLMKKQNIYLNSYDRNLHQYEAQERYAHMVEDFGDLLDSIPKKHRAAYVGIAPGSLSRILREMKGNNPTPPRHPLSMLLAF